MGNNEKKMMSLLHALREQKQMQLKGGIYHRTQIDLTYNSNHIEGSRLTHEQTRYIFETNTIGASNESINVDDVIETANHFRCIDLIIECTEEPLSERFIKELHATLKGGTSDSRKDWFAVGDYKRLPNEVGGKETTPPEQVHEEMAALLDEYNKKDEKNECEKNGLKYIHGVEAYVTENLDEKIRDKKERYQKMADRSLEKLEKTVNICKKI